MCRGNNVASDGDPEARLLLVENFSQYPATTVVKHRLVVGNFCRPDEGFACFRSQEQEHRHGEGKEGGGVGAILRLSSIALTCHATTPAAAAAADDDALPVVAAAVYSFYQ